MSRFAVLSLFIFLLFNVCIADEKRSTNEFTASASNWHLLKASNKIFKIITLAVAVWELCLSKSEMHLISASTTRNTSLDWKDLRAPVKTRGCVINWQIIPINSPTFLLPPPSASSRLLISETSNKILAWCNSITLSGQFFSCFWCFSFWWSRRHLAQKFQINGLISCLNALGQQSSSSVKGEISWADSKRIMQSGEIKC